MTPPPLQLVPRLVAELPTLPPPAMRDGTAGRILAGGLLLFARHGFHATSVRDIGDTVGLTPANLYAYFESKEQLLAELVRVGHEEHHRRLRLALVEAAPGPVAQVRALTAAHVRVHAEYAMLSVVADNELHALRPALAAPSLVLRRESEAMFGDVVRRGVEHGLFDPPDPWLAVAAIAGMGLRVAHWYRADAPQSLDLIADTYAEFAVRLLGVRP